MEDGPSRILSIFLARSTAGNMFFKHLTLNSEKVEDSNVNQAMITTTVPTIRCQGIPAPPTRYVLAKKGSVSKPNIIAAVNQNLTHKVIPNTFFVPRLRSPITRRAWTRKTIINMMGPARFQDEMAQPQFSGSLGNGSLGRTVKNREMKKHVISTIDARCAASIFNLNF